MLRPHISREEMDMQRSSGLFTELLQADAAMGLEIKVWTVGFQSWY